MAAIVEWIRKAVDTLADPEREQRVQALASRIHRTLQTRGRDFSLGQALAGIECREKDLVLAKERVYQTVLTNAWKDGSVAQSEQKVLRWVVTCLELPESQVRLMDLTAARDQFAAALGKAMEDGVLEPAEEAVLHQVAATVGSTVPQFARTFFRTEGEGFLRGIFLACLADGHLSETGWNHLLHTTAKLGISQAELLQAIQPQARRFVEHVLADAKADGQLTGSEEDTLRWLLKHLGLPADFGQYVEAEVRLLRTLTDIDRGKLQPISAPFDVEVRAGERSSTSTRRLSGASCGSSRAAPSRMTTGAR
jgi:tellurite resistance protein